VRSLLGSSADRRGLGISADGEREKALQPGDLSRLLTERANAADLDGIVALYEPDAMLAFPPGQVTTGHHAIRVLYEGMLSRKSTFPAGTQRPAIRNGDLALTSTQLPGQVTVVVDRPTQPPSVCRLQLSRERRGMSRFLRGRQRTRYARGVELLEREFELADAEIGRVWRRTPPDVQRAYALWVGAPRSVRMRRTRAAETMQWTAGDQLKYSPSTRKSEPARGGLRHT